MPGLVFASEAMMADIRKDASLDQVAHVAHLPGIVHHSLAMADIHWGYGFPIGGVAAFDEHDGVISPGGVGYDINCGVRLLRTRIPLQDVQPHLPALSSELLRAVPSGVGSKSHRTLSDQELETVLVQGAAWAVTSGFGRTADLDVTEERGTMRGANPGTVSERAKERGLSQLGSWGSGNHFCEIGWVADVFDEQAANAFGLSQGCITVLLHSGSRGLGYQICDDSLRTMLAASEKYQIELPDRQLCSAPLHSPEAIAYLHAMTCAVNYAFANRQMLTHFVRQSLVRFFAEPEPSLGLDLVYDGCHNVAKWERHNVDGKPRRLCVHRKGATRAFPAGHPDVPKAYQHVGHPVLVPGDMGRYSYVVVGTQQALHDTWGSACHGAGRVLSRQAALKMSKKKKIFETLQAKGVWVRALSKRTVAEEIPEAYKDVADVVDVMTRAGLVRPVVKLEPLAVIKG